MPGRTTPVGELFERRRPAWEAQGEANAILHDVIGRHDPSHVFALFSGGHDSLCSTHLASRHPRFTAVVHVNTEIGIERTRVFVRETCREFGWPLLEYRPPGPPFRDREGRPWGREGQTAYEALVERFGFPGPRWHGVMYRRLKERCLRQLQRDHREGNRPVVLVSGVRRQESRRRMGHMTRETIEGRRVWCAPIIEWDDHDKTAYREAHGLPTNEVAKRLCMSGECLCGAFARPGELAEVEAVDPPTARYIRSLELLVSGAGVKRCRWGEKPAPAGKKRKPRADQPWLPLCHGCEARAEEDDRSGRTG
jgi:3'-phosphoadenosine 5'-phosphosulfate sulfotransferase (PAPS reductase)/FAD synthetase